VQNNFQTKSINQHSAEDPNLGVPSHTNSANGGSVNSQDSLWNIKNNEAHGYNNGAAYVPAEYVKMQKQGKCRTLEVERKRI
jgi:hypothetical protein